MNFSPDSVAVRYANQIHYAEYFVTCPQCPDEGDCCVCLSTSLVSKATANNGEQGE